MKKGNLHLLKVKPNGGYLLVVDLPNKKQVEKAFKTYKEANAEFEWFLAKKRKYYREHNKWQFV